jgi:hypothetical protein
VQHALIQAIVCLALEFRVQTTQGCKINCVAVLCMAIMMRYQFIKIVNHVFIVHVRLVQTTHLVRLALVILIKTIHAFYLAATVLLDTFLTQVNRLIA